MGWSRSRRTAWVVAAAYFVGLVVLLVGPWGSQINRLTVGCYTFFRYDWPVAPDWALPHHYGFVLNVVLFVPLGALLVELLRRPWWTAVLLAALASTAVEVVQAVWLARVGAVDDVVSNTLGALVGALLVTPRRRRG